MQEPARASRLVRFGAFEADLRAGELRKQGLKIKLQEQPFEILTMLLEHPGEVVTREELQKRLWPADTFVDFDNSLNAAINKLRAALGDDADNPRFVETLPRRGYRFIAPVAAASPPPTAGGDTGATAVGADQRVSPTAGAHLGAPLRKRHVALAAGFTVAVLAVLLALNVAGLRERLLTAVGARRAVPLPKIESIAVLPLENLSGDPEQEYFADGMTDALITNLGQIRALRVISRTSAMHYKGTKKRLPEIARELNVDAVVEGSVMRSGDRVRITARLVQANPERKFWAGNFERDLRDVLALQSEVASAITEEIKAKVTPEEQTRLARARPVNPEAHEAYLKGRYFWNKRTGPGVRKGLEYFEQAIEKDPNYGLAYAGVADSYTSLTYYGPLPSAVAWPKARAAAQKALELDATLAEGHTPLAEVSFHYDWNWSAAEKEFRRAIALNPGYAKAHHGYAWFLTSMGRHDEALGEMKRAQELDPLSLIINTNVGTILFFRGEYDLAIEELRRTLELDQSFFVARVWLGTTYLEKGLNDEGVRELEKAVELSKSHPPALARLGYAYALSGRRDQALRILARLRQQSKQGYVPPYLFAVAYAGLGEKDQTFEWLEKAFRERYSMMTYLKGETAFRSLHSDPRFQDLLRRMNFPP